MLAYWSAVVGAIAVVVGDFVLEAYGDIHFVQIGALHIGYPVARGILFEVFYESILEIILAAP